MRTLALQRSTGGVLSAISAASGTQIDVYNFETLALARQQVNHLADGVRAFERARSPESLAWTVSPAGPRRRADG